MLKDVQLLRQLAHGDAMKDHSLARSIACVPVILATLVVLVLTVDLHLEFAEL
jgi:hypothetical protein